MSKQRVRAEEANNQSEIRLARLAAEEATANKERELELARLEHEVEMAKLAQQEKEKEREVELKRIESIEQQANQDRKTKFASKIELGFLSLEKAVYGRNPKLPYFEGSKDKMDGFLSRFEKYAVGRE